MKKKQVKVVCLLTKQERTSLLRRQNGTGARTESQRLEPRGVSELCDASSNHLTSKEQSIYSAETWTELYREICEDVQCLNGKPDSQIGFFSFLKYNTYKP